MNIEATSLHGEVSKMNPVKVMKREPWLMGKEMRIPNLVQ